MKTILISQRTYLDESSGEQRDCLDQKWHDFLAEASLLPLIVPNNLIIVKQLLNKFPVDGILLTGGNDSGAREEVEKFLLEKSIQHNLPCLGVCHGMQVIQKYLNIQLRPVTEQINAKALIYINDQPVEKNSYHTLGTTETIPELKVWAKGKDNIVKAVRHESYPWVGIMWHPERIIPFAADDIQLFKNFYN